MPVGWEDGVGHCRDAASFPENGPLKSLGIISGEQSYAFFQVYGFYLGLTAGYASSYEGAHTMLP